MPVTDVAQRQDCLACRIIGSGAIGASGVYALYSSRAAAPGSLIGKRIVGGIGVCKHGFLLSFLSFLSMVRSETSYRSVSC
jgi:hypothetical protein